MSLPLIDGDSHKSSWSSLLRPSQNEANSSGTTIGSKPEDIDLFNTQKRNVNLADVSVFGQNA